MKAWEEKFKTSLIEAIKLDDARLEDKMKNTEPHVFSESFEKRMEEVMKLQKRKNRTYSFSRSVAAIVLLVFLSGGVLLGSSEQLRASVARIDILSWMERFFTVEKGVGERKEESALFEESRLEYIPEGFERVLEEELFSKVYYRYQNKEGEYFTIQVLVDGTKLNVDNEMAQIEVQFNARGYEYTYISREGEYNDTIFWKDKEDVCYYIKGNVGYAELIKIMDGISY